MSPIQVQKSLTRDAFLPIAFVNVLLWVFLIYKYIIDTLDNDNVVKKYEFEKNL